MFSIHDFILTENTSLMANNSASLRIHPIPAFQDNYIWVIDNGQHALVVDPGTAEGVVQYLTQHHLILTTILITHHHNDHTGGIDALTEYYNPVVYGPLKEEIAGVTHGLVPGDVIDINDLGLHFAVLDFSGHTLGHIGYSAPTMLFCGDTLFSAGCGRIFEGTPERMFKALNSIKTLPLNTRIYCTHEYTQNNIEFALAVEPHNIALQQYAKTVNLLRQKHLPTLPTNLELELSVNPFLRTDQATLMEALASQYPKAIQDALSLFTFLRAWKNVFPHPPSLGH